LAQVRQRFLAGYASASYVPLDEGRLRAFQSASLLKIAGRRYPRLKVEQWERVPYLIDAAFDMLDPEDGWTP
jgi:hypothetical protein